MGVAIIEAVNAAYSAQSLPYEEEQKQEPVVEQPNAQQVQLEEEVKQDNSSSEEEMKATEEQNKLLYSKQVFRRYALGDAWSYEFGFQHEEEDVKIEIRDRGK